MTGRYCIACEKDQRRTENEDLRTAVRLKALVHCLVSDLFRYKPESVRHTFRSVSANQIALISCRKLEQYDAFRVRMLKTF